MSRSLLNSRNTPRTAGARDDEIGQLTRRIAELEAALNQHTPALEVRLLTWRIRIDREQLPPGHSANPIAPHRLGIVVAFTVVMMGIALATGWRGKRNLWGATDSWTPSAGFVTLADDFDDNTQDTSLWANTTYGSSNASVTVAETGGQVMITPLSFTGGLNYNGYESAQMFDFTGGRVQVELVQAPSGTAQAEFIIFKDSNNSIGFYTEGGRLRFFTYTAASQDRTATPYDATDHRFLRLTHNREVDQLVWETSRDGVVWTVRRTLTAPWDIKAVKFGLIGGTYQSVPAPGLAIWDNFRADAAVRSK